jgi:hypothetical protein
MANRTPHKTIRSFATLIAMFALLTLSLGSALGHNATGATEADRVLAAGNTTTSLPVLTDGGDVDEASEIEDVDEANGDSTDEDTVDDNDQGENSVDENDQGEDENADEDDQGEDEDSADENDQGADEQADENDDNQDEANDDDGDQQDEADDDSGDDGGDD